MWNIIGKVRKLISNEGLFFTGKKIYYKLWTRYCAYGKLVTAQISEEERQMQQTEVFAHMPLISIVVPLYNTPKSYLREMLDSVMRQTYGKWELCMADGSDKEKQAEIEKIIREYSQRTEKEETQSKILYKRLKENKGISVNTNVCMEMAAGEYIALLDHDDILHPSALYEAVKILNTKKADYIYTDEASFTGRINRLESIHMKPGFSPDNLRAVNYICHFSVFCRRLQEKVGGFQKEYDGSQDHDMILRLTEQAEHIVHISKVLYFWRSHPDSVAADISNKKYAVHAGINAVKGHLERKGLKGTVESLEQSPSMYRVEYEYTGEEKVTIICEKMGERPETSYKNVQWLCCGSGISWQEIRENIQGKYIIIVQKEFKFEKDSWIERCLSWLQREDVGAVGSKVISQNHKIFQAGLFWDGKHGCIRNVYAKTPEMEKGYMNQLCYARNVSMIGCGCLAVRKDRMEDVIGELGSSDFQKVFQSSNWWLWTAVLRQKKYENIIEPNIKMHFFRETACKKIPSSYSLLLTEEDEYKMAIKKISSIYAQGDDLYNGAYSGYLLHLYGN